MIKARNLTGARSAQPGIVQLRSRRWHVMRRIAIQELRDALLGWPIYLTTSIGVFGAVVLVYNWLSFVDKSGLQILARPFYVPVLIIAALAMLYVAAWATLAIVRPRDQGALRVLFFAPVDAAGLIGGHMLAGLALYTLIMLGALPLLVLLALLTNLPFPAELLVGAVLSPMFAAAILALGLFLSAAAPSSRSAMFFFVGLLIMVVAIQLGYGALRNIPATSRYYDALLFVRELLRGLRNALNWLSPIALLSTGLDAILRRSPADFVKAALAAGAGCGGWLVLAIRALKHRGVLP